MNKKPIQAFDAEMKRQKIERVKEVLSSNKMSYDFTVDSEGFIEIVVENGDWKHDHIALKQIMREAGFVDFGRHIPEEQDNGDDSFSAIYLYK